eukprot:m.196472 g.196472  ORF g.196472 m.196472 type:complete len:53 (+) comp18692_c0_seq2:1924-2082(+)
MSMAVKVAPPTDDMICSDIAKGGKAFPLLSQSAASGNRSSEFSMTHIQSASI